MTWLRPAAIGMILLTGMSGAWAEDVLTFDAPQCAGISGFRAHWDLPIPVAEDGERVVKDGVVKDRGQTAVWGGAKPGPLAFDAVHRGLLVRFPGAAEKVAEALAAGKAVAKAELVLPYLDEELWPTGSGGADYPCPDGYRYRMNWDCDKLYRAQRPSWHAVAHLLRKPWQADAATGPTYNAAVNGAVYWKRFGASDTAEDRFPDPLGPVEVSSYKPDGRMDVTAVLADAAYGKTMAERLRTLADCGFVIGKQEVYDARYFTGAYEWAISTGPRAVLVRQPRLVVTLKPGAAEKAAPAPPADVPALAAQLRGKPRGAPTAVIPPAAEIAKLNEKFLARPAWMPEWQYAHVRQLMGLESGGKVEPFYCRIVPPHVINRVREAGEREAKQRNQPFDADYAVYLAWLDWVHGCPPRWWDGHLTGANNVTQWYNYREALPAPVQESILRSWTAWLMPDRESQLDPKLRRQCDEFSGKLVHPMVDDPRVGKFANGKPAEWNQGDTYYKKTGDWCGNKSYYRSGFTREMSTANFNSSASSGALLNGQIIGSANAMADGRAGLMQFPFWMWTHSAGVGQEYIDHYYWAIATAANKNFADFCREPEDRMAGWSIMSKTVNDLAGGYHPNLKKLMGPASRTYTEHVLGYQDGLYHILHVLSPKGALSDVETGTLPALTAAKDGQGSAPRPISAWGHDYPAAAVALQSLSGPWADPWLSELVDEKPLPWSLYVEKEGDPVVTHFGESYGLSCIRQKPQRIHVLGHWRRKAAPPAGMRDIGTLDVRIGFNQTTVGCDGEGVISQQGVYRCYQSGPTLILLARPQPNVIAQQAGEHPFGQRKLPAQEIKSVQCSAALFNYEQPAPTWEIFIDDKKVGALPATAKQGQVITVRDGVSYLALRPLPTDDLGRDADITLEAGQPQTQPYHESTNIQPALFVHANFYRRGAALGPDALKILGSASSGFVVEMADEKECGSFEVFRKRVLAAKLGGEKGTVTYASGKDTLAASWDSFTVNGRDPCADAKEKQFGQDTTLTQMGRARLEKNGAVVERGKRHPELNLFLQTFPRQKRYVVMNLLPNYLDYRFRDPGGVGIAADGACSMGRWSVKDSREIDVLYHAFGGDYAPKARGEAATVLLVTGVKGKPQVTLNGKDITASLKAWKREGVEGWLVPLAGAFLPDAELASRLQAAGR
jgi:hypothetical protein